MTEYPVPCRNCNKKDINEIMQNWSSTYVKVVKLKHIWTITNFSFCHEKAGEKLVSPIFSAGNNSDKSEWCLWLFPKGQDTKKNGKYVSLFMQLVKTNMSDILTKYKLAIVNSKGELVKILQDSHRFPTSSSGWGYEEFVTQDFLFNARNEVLLDDKLTILCEINVTVGSENISGSLTMPKNDLALDFKFLFENAEFSNVTLIAGGKEFPAHKVILAARSSVFRAMFQSDMVECRNNRVKITDIDEEGLREMLRYMYTGKINKLEIMAPGLLNMAEKYELDDLKMKCEEELFKSLSRDNVAEIFILSDKFRTKKLKNQVKEFIAVHASFVGQIPEFQSMIRTHPHLAIEAFCALSD